MTQANQGGLFREKSRFWKAQPAAKSATGNHGMILDQNADERLDHVSPVPEPVGRALRIEVGGFTD
jgi:hypothetical protein